MLQFLFHSSALCPVQVRPATIDKLSKSLISGQSQEVLVLIAYKSGLTSFAVSSSPGPWRSSGLYGAHGLPGTGRSLSLGGGSGG